MGQFRFRDDIVLSDCALEITAGDLVDVYETAARALAELMVDPATLEESAPREVALEASSWELLLFDWLSDLIARKDVDQEVFPRAEVHLTRERSCRLEAKLFGGRIVTGRTARRADVKGVTLHRFALAPVQGGWHASCVLDL